MPQSNPGEPKNPGPFALITGGGTGIGQACATALASDGYRLLLLGRRAAPLQQSAAALPNASALQADLADESALEAAVAAVGQTLDVLIHAAGHFHYGPLQSTTAQAWNALGAANLHGPLLLTAKLLPALQRAGGTIVFINSTAALNPGANAGAYAASKAALKAAADALRQEVNPLGVRVLSVFPGRTDTPMQDEVLSSEGRYIDRSRLLAPADVAAITAAAVRLPPRAQITDLVIRPTHI